MNLQEFCRNCVGTVATGVETGVETVRNYYRNRYFLDKGSINQPLNRIATGFYSNSQQFLQRFLHRFLQFLQFLQNDCKTMQQEQKQQHELDCSPLSKQTLFFGSKQLAKSSFC